MILSCLRKRGGRSFVRPNIRRRSHGATTTLGRALPPSLPPSDAPQLRRRAGPSRRCLAQPLGTDDATLPAAALKLQLADEITTQSSGRGRRAEGEAVDCAAAGEGSLSSPSHLSSFIFFIFRSFFLRFKLDVVDIKLAISIRRRHVRPSSKRNGLLPAE